MTLLQRIDVRLFEATARLAHAIQWATGIISYRLAQQLFVIEMVWAFVRQADYWYQPLLKTSETDLVIALISPVAIWFYGYLAVLSARAASRWQDNPSVVPVESLLVERVTEWLRPLFAVFILARTPIALLALAVMDPSAGVEDVVILFIDYAVAFGFYFALVPPLPPGRERNLVLATSENR